MTDPSSSAPASNNKAVYLWLLKRIHAQLASSNSLAAPHYAVAIRSLTACPVPMASIETLNQLNGFSAGIRRRLNQIITEEGGLDAIEFKMEEEGVSQRSSKGRCSLAEELDNHEAEQEQLEEDAARLAATKSKKTKRPTKATTSSATAGPSNNKKPCAAYMPNERSGGWGILMGLYLLSYEDDQEEEGEASYHSKDDIILKAKKYSRASYTYSVARRPGPSNAGGNNNASGAKFLTAWGGMKTLLNRGLVYQKGRPMTFGLSEEGQKVAREIATIEGKTVPLDHDAEHDREAAIEQEDNDDQGEASASVLLSQLDSVRERAVIPVAPRRKKAAVSSQAPPIRRPLASRQMQSSSDDDDVFRSSDIEAGPSRNSQGAVPSKTNAPLVNPSGRPRVELKLPEKTRITALYLPTKNKQASRLVLPERGRKVAVAVVASNEPIVIDDSD